MVEGLLSQLRPLRSRRRVGIRFLLIDIMIRLLARSSDSIRSPSGPIRMVRPIDGLREIHPVQSITSEDVPATLLNPSRIDALSFYRPNPAGIIPAAKAGVVHNILVNPRQSEYLTESGEARKGIWQEEDHLADLEERLGRLRVDQPAERIEGTSVSLCGPWSDNYYHWLMQYLPRTEIARAIVPDKQVDWFLLPEPLLDFQVESLSYVGIDKERIRPLQADRWYQPERCVQTTIPGAHRHSPDWLIEFLRDRLPSDRRAGARWFIGRRDASFRNIVNFDEVLEVVNAAGFEELNPAHLTFKEQIDAFHSASHIIAVHGAALANLVFANDCSVLELIPVNFSRGTFRRLCHRRGLGYQGIVGIEPRSPIKGRKINEADLIVDISLLEKYLAQLGRT